MGETERGVEDVREGYEAFPRKFFESGGGANFMRDNFSI